MKKVLSILLTVVMLLSTLSVFSVLSVSAADIGTAVSSGNGNAADKPAGSGTQNDPYLIATLANLNWLRKEIKDAQTNATYGRKAEEGVTASFDGVYFEQTADIDLNGGTFNSIGGYICDPLLVGNTDTNKHPGYTYMGAFGGHYNGNGYKIYNGTIAPASGTNNKTNINWASGFIAVLYGGTVKNLVFDDIDFQHNTLLNGNVVGVAHAPLAKEITVSKRDSEGAIIDGSQQTIPHPDAAYVGDPSFNVIENVVVKDTCTSTFVAGGKFGDVDWANGMACGGIVGRAISTTVRGCVNQADMAIPAGTMFAGGIAAYVANSALIENCKFTGTMTLSGNYADVMGTVATSTGTRDAAWSAYADVEIGGIVGTIACNANSMNAVLYNNHKSVKILNCYNSGNLTLAAGTNFSVGSGAWIVWGGILAGFNTLKGQNANSETIEYRMENCHNTTPATIPTFIKTADSSQPNAVVLKNGMRVGGLSGNTYSNAGAIGTIYVKNCFSVDGTRNYSNGTNEISIHTRVSTLTSLRPVKLEGANAIKADGTAYADGNNIDQTYATRALTDYIYETTDGTTYTLSETVTFQDVIDGMDKTIAKMHARGTDKVTAVGYQEALDNTTYRVVLGINSTRWFAIGAEVSLTLDGNAAPKTADKSNDTVYNGVQGKVDGQTKTWMASDLYVGYLSTLDITGVAEDGTSVYTIRTYVKDQDANHTKIYGDVIVVTFVDGVFQNAVVNPTA